jgi:hypothetical protein
MTKKDLEQIKDIRAEIRMLDDEITRLRQQSLTASGLGDGMPHAHNAESPTERIAIQINELCEKVFKYRSDLVLFLSDCLSEIYKIDDSTTRMIAKYRCVDGMQWAEISALVDTSERTAKRKYGEWLDTIK